MDRVRVARELLRIACLLTHNSVSDCRFCNDGRNRKAYGLIRNPERLVRALRDSGITIDRDGIVNLYPFTALGVPDWSGRPVKVKEFPDAVKQTQHILNSLQEKTDDHKKLLDMVTRIRRIYSDGADAASIAIEKFNRAPYVLTRLTSRSDPNRVKIKKLVDDLAVAVLGDNERVVNKLIDELQNTVELAIVRWSKQVVAIKKRRGLLLALGRKLQSPEEFVEIVENI